MSGVIAAGRGTEVPQVHPSGKNILGEGNLAFMHGPPHKAIRKSFLSLFTRKALSMYVELQDGIIRRQIRGWLDRPGEREIRTDIRCGQQLKYAYPDRGYPSWLSRQPKSQPWQRKDSAAHVRMHIQQARVVISVTPTG